MAQGAVGLGPKTYGNHSELQSFPGHGESLGSGFWN
jgi:hypothetical protein